MPHVVAAPNTDLSPYPSSSIEPIAPFRIAGPIHYVGTRGLAAYLIVTPKGHILLDGGLPQCARDIDASIHALGYRPEDIQLLIISHAHIEHAGTLFYFRRLSGAPVAVMDRDVGQLASGGRTDPVYADDRVRYFPPVRADRALKDREVVAVGKLTLRARLSAGHTRGATTWTTTIEEGDRNYNVVFAGCTGVSSAHRLVADPSYPGIAQDYRKAFSTLESLQPDIFLASHTDTFDFDAKRARAERDGVAAWVDPHGYRRWLAAGKSKFDIAIAREREEFAALEAAMLA